MTSRILLLLVLSLLFVKRGLAEEPLGERPYEMVWAKRTHDNRPPLLDFEDLEGWTVACRDAVAGFTRSREQQLWGKYVGKLVYRGDGNNPTVTLRPARPVPVPQPFDCINLWVCGNNWAWAPDRSTPPVSVHVLLRGRGGQQVQVPLGSVRWKEWWVMHRRLTPEQLATLGDEVVVLGIELTGCKNPDDRLLYFDNLAVYQEELPPLTFEPRPARGVVPFPGQSTGTNTGPEKLPFPTREETILPDNLTKEFTAKLEKSADGFAFHYREQAGDTVVSTWQCRWKDQTAEVAYTFRLWQKSLVIDIRVGISRPLPIERFSAVGCQRN